MSERIQQDCNDCKGTGLFEAAESAGTAVVCPVCRGEGWRWLKFTPFQGRKPSRGVQLVRRYGKHHAADAPMSYAEFEATHPPRLLALAAA